MLFSSFIFASGNFAVTRDGLDSRGAARHRVSPNHPEFQQNYPRAVVEWGNELFLMFEKLGVRKYETKWGKYHFFISLRSSWSELETKVWWEEGHLACWAHTSKKKERGISLPEGGSTQLFVFASPIHQSVICFQIENQAACWDALPAPLRPLRNPRFYGILLMGVNWSWNKALFTFFGFQLFHKPFGGKNSI